MTDYIVRATAGEAQIRAFACTAKGVVEKARQAHNTSPVVTAALGRLLCGGVMMGSMLKGEEDLLTLQIKGDGPMQGLMVTADSRGNVKGYATVPDVILPASAAGKLDVGGAIGQGTLRVIKDMGLKEPYVGQTLLQTGEIAEDLTYYFATSEQLMPFAEAGVIARLEENLSRITSVTAMLDEGKTPEQMLECILEGLNCEITEVMPAAFTCNCDRSRIEKVLISLGKQELHDMIDEGQEIEVNCHFCNKQYKFSVEELKQLYHKSR